MLAASARLMSLACLVVWVFNYFMSSLATLCSRSESVGKKISLPPDPYSISFQPGKRTQVKVIIPRLGVALSGSDLTISPGRFSSFAPGAGFQGRCPFIGCRVAAICVSSPKMLLFSHACVQNMNSGCSAAVGVFYFGAAKSNVGGKAENVAVLIEVAVSTVFFLQI